MAWRSYALTVLIGWLVLGAAGFWIVSDRNFAWPSAAPVLAAFLLEFAFYVFPAFQRLREELVDRVPVIVYAGLLALSGVVPYLVACFGGAFDLQAFVRLLIIVVVVSYWYVFRRPSLSSDVAILALVGVILLAKVFRTIYVFRIEERVDILGNLMLFRLFFMVMLTIREVDRTGFTYLPSWKEWKIGFLHFAAFAPLGFGVAWLMGFVRWEPTFNSIALAPLQFMGALWVIALFEEFLFRGLILQRLEDYTRKPVLAVVLSSILFGLAHISFGMFPNWKFVTLAGIAGLFYGHAFQKGQGIGAAMVAHAFTVTLWRTLFKL
jgi:membrane protease YdiL (CAAX protease family)